MAQEHPLDQGGNCECGVDDDLRSLARDASFPQRNLDTTLDAWGDPYLEYESQDFWVFYNRQFAPSANLQSLFESDGTRAAVTSHFGDQATFSEFFFDFAKNQTFDCSENLGELPGGDPYCPGSHQPAYLGNFEQGSFDSTRRAKPIPAWTGRVVVFHSAGGNPEESLHITIQEQSNAAGYPPEDLQYIIFDSASQPVAVDGPPYGPFGTVTIVLLNTNPDLDVFIEIDKRGEPIVGPQLPPPSQLVP